MKKFIDDIKSSITVKKGSTVTTVLLCIVVATIFWFFNSLNKEYSTNLNYPVEFVYDTDNYLAVSNLPEEVMLNVTGVGWNLLRKSIGLKVAPIQIHIENPGEIKNIPGSSLPGIVTDQVTDISLNYVLTDTLYVNLDRKVSRTYSLEIDSAAVPLGENHVIVSEINLSHDSVTLIGPEKKLNLIYDPIYLDLSGTQIEDDFDEEVQIRIPENRLITRDPPTVSVQFEVRELENASVQLPIRLNAMNQKYNGVFRSPDSVSTVFFKYFSDQDPPNLSEFSISINPETFNENDSTATLILTKRPKNIFNIDIDSSRFKVIQKQ